ncbi:MAG: pentapeptide repeat-containing protein [Actinomycetota bacterium]
MDQVQTWIAVIGGLFTAVLGILKYFNYRSRRDRIAAVGHSFSSTVDGLSSESSAKQLAAAILLRRFFDASTEQGAAGVPYGREAIAVIAALLRSTPSSELQKLLADGLGYAETLHKADLQGCNLSNAYLGQREQASRTFVSRLGLRFTWPRTRPDSSPGGGGGSLGGEERFESPVDLTHADMFEADLTGASLRGALAQRAVFYRAKLRNTVFEEAHLEGADFRQTDLDGTRFTGAWLGGARFEGAQNIPSYIEELLDEDKIVPPDQTAPVSP